MRDHMTPQAHYKHNTLIHRHTSSQQTQDRKATNYSTRWHQTPEMKMFSSLWVRLNLPDTFIENEEFVICQTFLLEDCDDSIVDAAAPNTQKPFLTLLSHMYFNTILFGPRYYLMYLFQVALAPALFCFSPLSSGELFSLFPSSLRLGELISLSRCRVLMREI